jgi:8-oxo-dGTP diphosphatase
MEASQEHSRYSRAPNAEVPERITVSDTEVIQGAGVVLWRLNKKTTEIALVHRPKYDDWSLPKGKVESGEIHLSCAAREAGEETGFEVVLGPEIGTAKYLAEGTPKEVRYWSAQAIGESHEPRDKHEVDQVIWLSVSDAKKKVSVDDDREIIKFFESFGINTTPIVLLRHAKALKREEWEGDDGDRPLDNRGQLQAKRMHSIYQNYGITEIHTSDAQRCIETIQPMAKSLKLIPIFSSDLSEYRYEKDKEAPLGYVWSLLKPDLNVVVCSHNPILPKLVKKLIGKKNFKKIEVDLLPGEAFILHHRDGEVIAVDWIEAPAV